MVTKYGAVTIVENRESSSDIDRTSGDDHQRISPVDSQSPATQMQPHRALVTPRLKWLVLTLIALIIVLCGTAFQLRAAPLVAVYREKICAELAGKLGREVNDDFCKSNPDVERQVALILGTAQLLESIPVLLLSSVYGSLADRYGRRPILLLGALGLFLNTAWVTLIAGLAPKVPLKLVWIGPAFWTIGGGNGVIVAIVMTTAADVVAVENKANVFAFIHAASLLSLMLGTFLGSIFLMRLGSYPPLVISLILIFVGFLFCFFLPDTQPPRIRELHASPISDSSTDSLLPKQTKALPVGERTDSFFGSFLRSFHDIRKARGALPILIAAFVVSLSQPLSMLTFQYMPYRFGIDLAKSNLFNILNNGLSCLVLVVVLPTASTILIRRCSTPFTKDLILARTCGYILLVGALLLTVAPNIPIAVMGLALFSPSSGMVALLRSMIIDVFPVEDAAFATTLISTCDAIAGNLTGTMFSALFAWSLNWNNILKGLPFFVTALSFVVTICALSIVRTPARMLLRSSDDM